MRKRRGAARKEEGRVKTELYVKPTDRTRYKLVDSDYPCHEEEV